MANHPLGTRATTGQKCPESGVWKVTGSHFATALLTAGNTMPPYGGLCVTWELIQYA
ncbi:MAG: hypothetical protein AB9900_04630 [Humidesulfovibrio sp.]